MFPAGRGAGERRRREDAGRSKYEERSRTDIAALPLCILLYFCLSASLLFCSIYHVKYKTSLYILHKAYKILLFFLENREKPGEEGEKDGYAPRVQTRRPSPSPAPYPKKRGRPRRRPPPHRGDGGPARRPGGRNRKRDFADADAVYIYFRASGMASAPVYKKGRGSWGQTSNRRMPSLKYPCLCPQPRVVGLAIRVKAPTCTTLPLLLQRWVAETDLSRKA